MYKTKNFIYFIVIFFVFFGGASFASAAEYYIDPTQGSDTNTGSFANPWKTFANIQSYYQSSWRPAGWINLQPGDVIYLRAGVHNSTRTPGGATGQSGGTRAIAYFRDWGQNAQSGTQAAPIRLKSYPGERAIIGDISTEPYGYGLYIESAEWWEVSDIEFRNIPGDCVNFSGGADFKLWNLEVHDCARKDTDGNPAGIKFTQTDRAEIFNSNFYDTFWDPAQSTPPGGGTWGASWFPRGAGVQLFQGQNFTIHDNVFTNTKQLKDPNGLDVGYANCMFQKHAQSVVDGYLNVYNNTFDNCRMAFGSGTQNTWFYNNIITNSPSSIEVADFGGITYQVNQLYEYNTIVNSKAFTMGPSMAPYNNLFPILPKNITYRNNIIVDRTTSYTSEYNMIDIGTYMNDTFFDATAAAPLSFSNNCYYNPNTQPRFQMGGANNDIYNTRPQYGVKGGYYGWSQWQSLTNNGQALNFDVNSLIANPLFINEAARDFNLQSTSPCKAMGAYSLSSTPDTTPPSAPIGLVVR